MFDKRYGIVTLMWMAGIYWLSSRPDLSSTGSGQAVQAASNLAHLPLFAGLALCWFKTLAGLPRLARYAVAFVATATWAALDEWHQSFVPGREASSGDFLVGLTGIIVMLFALHQWAARETRAARTLSLHHPAASAPVARSKA